MTITAHFAPADAHFSGTPDGEAAMVEYLMARELGKDHDEATILASNVLQRAGYNVNARGGISIDTDEAGHGQ